MRDTQLAEIICAVGWPIAVSRRHAERRLGLADHRDDPPNLAREPRSAPGAVSYVVDTSVFLRWWVEQVGSQHAQRVRDRFLAGDISLVTPDFTRIQLTEVLRKRALLEGVMTEDEYLAAVETLDVLGVDLVPADRAGLFRAAALAAKRSLRISTPFGASLSLDRGLPLLTAAARAARALAGVIDVEVLKGI